MVDRGNDYANIDLLDSSQTRKATGMNKDGNYICLDGTSIFIVADLSGSVIASYNSLLDPRHAIQTESGTYIVCDYGNDRVVELNSSLSGIVNAYSINNPVFVDYFHENKTTLVTADNTISEISLDMIIRRV